MTLPEYIINKEKARSEKELNKITKVDLGYATKAEADTAISATTINYTSTPSSILDGISIEASPYETCTVGSLISDVVSKADLYVGNRDICSSIDTLECDLSTKADKAEVDRLNDEFAKTNTATNKLYDAMDAVVESLKNYIDPLGSGKGINLEPLEKAGFIEFKNNSYIKINEEKKGINDMFNFDFGPCKGNNVKMCMYGLAVKSPAGDWVSYNAKEGEIFTVSEMVFGDANYFYKIPVAIKDIKPGDLVVHNCAPMYVEKVLDNGTLRVVDVMCAEKKNIIVPKSPWGFNFATKIVSLMDMMNTGDNTPSEDNPFGGNMLALMMMTSDTKIDPMMLMLMSGGQNMNPMMMYALMANKK